MRSFTIVRPSNSSKLYYSSDKHLYMTKDSEYFGQDVFFSSLDMNLGFFHTDNQVISYVEVYNDGDSYFFRDYESKKYYSSKPIQESLITSAFLPNKKLVQKWERFVLEEMFIHQFAYVEEKLNSLSKYSDNTIKLFWYSAQTFINMGDEINQYIVSHLAQKKVERVAMANTELLGIGSILDWAKPRSKPYRVWGSGTLSPSRLLGDSSYQLSLLRGPLTQSLMQD